MKFIYKLTILIFLIGSFNLVHSLTKTFTCADGYELKIPSGAFNTKACWFNPDKSCCECIVGQTICNINHKGLKPGSYPKGCNTACLYVTGKKMDDILSALKKRQKYIPVKNFWEELTKMLNQ